MNKNQQNNNFNFITEEIGNALTFIVSNIENEEYILEYVTYYEPTKLHSMPWEVNSTTLLSIVKSGYEDLYFIKNHTCPWMIDKISHPIMCVHDPLLCINNEHYRKYDPYRKKVGNFETEFQDNSSHLKVNPFPYLNKFIQGTAKLQNNRRLTQEEIMCLAEVFIKQELKEKEITLIKKN